MRCTPQAPARRAQPDAGQRRNAVTGMSRAPSVPRHVFTVYTEPSGASNLVQCGRGYDGAATRARHGGFRPVHPNGHACAHLRQPRLRRHGRSPVAHVAPCRGTRHRYRFMWWPVQPALSLLASRRLRKRSLPLRPTISPRTCARAHYMRRAGPRAPPLGHLLSPFFILPPGATHCLYLLRWGLPPPLPRLPPMGHALPTHPLLYRPTVARRHRALAFTLARPRRGVIQRASDVLLNRAGLPLTAVLPAIRTSGVRCRCSCPFTTGVTTTQGCCWS